MLLTNQLQNYVYGGLHFQEYENLSTQRSNDYRCEYVCLRHLHTHLAVVSFLSFLFLSTKGGFRLSSSGVQMEHQGLFTMSVSMRCLLRSGQGGIPSIRVIYERLY